MPSMPMTTRSTINVKSPALETAAAVSCPEIAEAMLSPAKTSMTMKRTMIPKGVLIMPMIELVADPLAILFSILLQNRESVERGGKNWLWYD